MYDVAVYLSSLPRISGRERKIQHLQAFYEGALRHTSSVKLHTHHDLVDAKLAVILGWVGNKLRMGPHLLVRKNAIETQQRLGRHIMPIDGSCFKFADTDSHFLRYSLGGVYYNQNNYANKGSSPHKWEQISSVLGLRLDPWQIAGNHILICLQRDTGWSMKGVDMLSWLRDTMAQIRVYSDRPIVIRPHPKYPIDPALISGFSNTVISTNPRLQQDVAGAWAAVFFNSSSCVAPVLAGVPVFATDQSCVAWSVSNHDLAKIESPDRPDREQWLWDLSGCHWSDEESRAGLIYKHFEPCLS
jgi:hypothetical protein